MYFTDRGIEELGERRGEEQVTLGWPPGSRPSPAFIPTSMSRLATWLARADDEDDEL